MYLYLHIYNIFAYLFTYVFIYHFAYLISHFRNKSTKYMNKTYVSQLIRQVDNFVSTMQFENFFSISVDQLYCSTDQTTQ